MWLKILHARHGNIKCIQNGQQGVRGRSNNTGWWSKVLALVGGSGNGWFWSNLSQKLGNGSSISFWNEIWVGDKQLRELFPRLFHLCSDKEGIVRDMGYWVGNH